MKIDCRNLPCPKPIMQTKNALEKLKVGENLEIVLNSLISKNNVLKFLHSLNLSFSVDENEDEFYIKVQKKNVNFNEARLDDYRVLFLKSDKIGAGELGTKLLANSLKILKELENCPSKILCVNESVLMNVDENHLAFKAMRELESFGVEIISCGACLEFFNKSQELKIGSIGNAYEILNELFGKAKIITF